MSPCSTGLWPAQGRAHPPSLCPCHHPCLCPQHPQCPPVATCHPATGPSATPLVEPSLSLGLLTPATVSHLPWCRPASAVPRQRRPHQNLLQRQQTQCLQAPGGNKHGKLGCVRPQVLHAHLVTKHQACLMMPLLKTLFRQNKTGPPGPWAVTTLPGLHTQLQPLLAERPA